MLVNKMDHVIRGVITFILIASCVLGIGQLVQTTQSTQSQTNTNQPLVKATDLHQPVDPAKLLTHVIYRNQDDFLSLLSGYVDEAYQHGIFPSVMMAQAILESGSDGSSQLALESKNLFGMKGHYKGQSQEWSTFEDEGGQQYYDIQDGFRHYDSYHDSIMDYLAKLGTEDRYKQVPLAQTPQEQAHLIHEAGYATDDAYTEKLIDLMETYNLYQYN